MTQTHIASDDFVTGTTFNGAWNFNQAVTGFFPLKDSFVQDGEIPWIYDGCNLLVVRQNATTNQETINFGEEGKTDAVTVENLFEVGFDSITFLGGTLATFNALTNEYDIVVAQPIDILWDISTARFPFASKRETTELNVTAFSIPALFIDNRPKYIEFHINEHSSPSVATTRPFAGDLFVSTFDGFANSGQIAFPADVGVTQMNLQIRLPHIPNVICPMQLRWDLIFANN